MLSADDAARSLQEHLDTFPWVRMIGVGKAEEKDILIVYVSRNNRTVRNIIPESWEGYPVTFRRMSQPLASTI